MISIIAPSAPPTLDLASALNLRIVMSAVFTSERRDDNLLKVRDRRQKQSGDTLQEYKLRYSWVQSKELTCS